MLKIHNFEELSKVPANDKYYIVIDENMDCGWIKDIKTNKTLLYLSTHTFYKKSGIKSYYLKKKYRFDIKIIKN